MADSSLIDALPRPIRKWLQRWHALLAWYHLGAFKCHCKHLPAWFIEDVFRVDSVPGPREPASRHLWGEAGPQA